MSLFCLLFRIPAPRQAIADRPNASGSDHVRFMCYVLVVPARVNAVYLVARDFGDFVLQNAGGYFDLGNLTDSFSQEALSDW